MSILVWCGIGFAGWLFFGMVTGDKKFSPFDAPEFYFLILPMCLLCPVGGWGAACLVPFLSKR